MNSLKPKDRFLKTQDAKVLSDLVLNDSFQNAITAALAEMQMNQPSPDNPSKAWDSACRMTGAKEFISILLNIADKELPPKKLPDKNLKPID